MNYSEKIDPENMLGKVLEMPSQLLQSFEVPEMGGEIEKMVFCGMGGSGFGGDLMAARLAGEAKIPAISWKNFGLPAWADEKTLVIITSYSGKTVETINALKEIIARKIPFVAISAGGIMETMAKENGRWMGVPPGYMPRAATAYLVKAQAAIVDSVLSTKLCNELDKTSEFLRGISTEKAQEVSKRIQGRIPWITGYGHLMPTAYRWQTQFNENSKAMAFSSEFPELCHNLLVAIYRDKLLKNIAPIFLRANDEGREMRIIIETTKEMLARNNAPAEEITCSGKSKFEEMFYSIYTGDLASVYFAYLNNENPTPVEPMPLLKERLNKK